MDFKNRHPLNAIEGYENLSMLEALIPFVDYSLKLPLALFLKYSETKLIIKCFQSTENLIRLGLHNPYSDPLDMICTFTGMSKEMLSMLFSMMEGGDGSIFSNVFNNTANPWSDTGTENTTFGFSPEDITNAMNMFHSVQHNSDQTQEYETSDDFEQNIQQLFTEYDLEQAQEFDSSTQKTSTDYNNNYDNSSSPYRY